MSDRHADTVRAHLEALESWGISRVVRRSGNPRFRRPASHDASPPIRERTAPPPRPTSAASVPAPAPAPVPTPMAGGDWFAERAAAVAACEKCELSATRTKAVFGVGNPRAELMFVGEAPGRDEDLRGEPFVGRAGQLLDKIIGAMGMAREEVYIANVLKCRPPQNRDPRPEEVAACTPYLDEQIAKIRPQIIVALGRPAANYLLRTTDALGRLRGRIHDRDGTPVAVTYHPAYLLRSPGEKRKTWDDMKMVLRHLGRPVPEPRR